MPEFRLSSNASLFHRDECFADPWTEPEAMLLHGNAESGEAWNAWMPHVARRFRTGRPDMRGFGRSTPMPLGHPRSPDGLAEDLIGLMDHFGIERFHLVGAKIASPLAMRLAARHAADRLRLRAPRRLRHRRLGARAADLRRRHGKRGAGGSEE
jgi:3-oxoadipate enol-lactonase